jgi:hypothetical protein
MATQVLIPREQSVWVVDETTEGTSVLPAATDAIAVVGTSTLNQESSYTNSEEIANSRSILDQARDMTGPGEFRFQTYIRVDSAAGSIPNESDLWEGLLGTETISAGSSVTYTPAINRNSYTVWWKISNVVLAGFGAKINQVEVSSGSTGYTTCDWTGNFLQLGFCGESTLSGAHTAGATSIAVTDGAQFSEGMFIQINSMTNADAGYKISSVSGNTLTIADGITAAASDTDAVEFFMPDHTLSGDPMEARGGALTIDSAATTYRTFSITMANGDEAITDEVTSSGYASNILGGQRESTGTINVIFRTNDLDHYTRGQGTTRYEVKFTNTNTVPDRVFTITMPYCRLQVPTVEEATPAMGLAIPYTALASDSGEDEVSVKFSTS